MKVKITETVLRDSQQSLIATRMPFSDFEGILETLDNAGYYSLECWGGATFDSCLRYLDEDPWERLRKIKDVCKKTPLQMLIRGQNILGYKHYPDDVVRLFCRKAAENGMDIFRIFDALNDFRNIEVCIDEVKKCGKHAQGCICYTTSPVHTIEKYVEMCKELENMGVDSIETYTFTCLAFDDNAKSVSFLYSKRWADNLCRLAQKRSRQDSSYYCGGTALPK